MNNSTYKFVKTEYPQTKMLLCPQCCEMLNRIDVEHFSSCPFCSYSFELNDQLEDFLLEPIVDMWMTSCVHHAPSAAFFDNSISMNSWENRL